MQVANTEVIAAPERGVTTADLAVLCEAMARSNRSIDAPRPTLRMRCYLAVRWATGLTVPATAMSTAAKAATAEAAASKAVTAE
jgi:hypothetical protein